MPTGEHCWIRARGSVIRGSLYADGSKLSVEDVPPRPAWVASHYALDLAGTTVEGSLYLRPGFEADGGLSLAGSHIHGDVWCDGASLRARNNYALFAQGTTVRGGAVLRGLSRGETFEPFRSQGRLVFNTAEFLGGLDLTGAILEQSSDGASNGALLDFSSVRVEDFFFLRNAVLLPDGLQQGGSRPTESGTCVAQGLVRLVQSTITGHVEINGVLEKLISTSSLIGTSIFFDKVSYPVEFQAGARVEGSLTVRGNGGSLSAAGLVVTGDLWLHGKFKTPIDLRRANVGGSATFDLELEDGAASRLDERPDLDFEDAHVGGDLTVKRVEKSTPPVSAIAPPLIDVEPGAGGMRSHALDFYPGWSLAEVMVPGLPGEVRLLSFLWRRSKKRRGWRFWRPTTELETILLPGASPPIHQFNSRGILKLDNPQRRLDYLRFFCGHIWGDQGPFPIIETLDQLPRPGASQAQVLRLEPLTAIEAADGDAGVEGSGPWKFKATMLYGNGLFNTKLVLKSDGMVEMEDDQPVSTLDDLLPVRYEKPARIYASSSDRPVSGEWPVPPLVGDQALWDSLETSQAGELWRELRGIALTPSKAVKAPRKLLVSLARSKARALRDGRSGTWGQVVRVDLNGFEYDGVDVSMGGSAGSAFHQTSAAGRVWPAWALKLDRLQKQLLNQLERRSAPHRSKKWADSWRSGWSRLSLVLDRFVRASTKDNEWRARVNWLKHQVLDLPLKERRGAFSPQPFELLAASLRRQGEPIGAREVTLQKLRLHRKVVERFPSKVAWLLFDLFFGYALKPWRAIGTFGLCWVLGILFIDLANYGQLRVPFRTSDGIQILNEAGLDEDPVFVFDVPPAGLIDESAKGEPVTPPLLPPVPQPLQAPRSITDDVPCKDRIDSAAYALGVFLPILDLGQEARCTISSRPDALPWRTGKALYQLLGWVVTTLTLFTVGKRILSHLEKAGDSVSNN